MNITQKIPRILIVNVLSFVIACMPLNAQNSGYWRVFFRDKGNEVVAPGSTLWYTTLSIHSQRCLDRRKLNNPKAPLITQEDAPIPQEYVQAVSKFADTVLLQLRWNNYIVVKTDSARLASIKNLKFVKSLQRTGVKLFPAIDNSITSSAFIQRKDQTLTVLSPKDNCGVFRYGPSYNQAQLLQVPSIHQMGITGQGALVSFLDSGFRWKQHVATKDAHVLAEYDFIRKDSVTENQQMDVSSQDYHGSICYSTVSGFQQDSLIGIAPFSSFLLAKTEDIPTEQHLEEDNYAAAVEWSEALGADIISSSLGYSVFNQPFEEDYVFTDFDGKTTITSRIVNQAVKRGVICVTAAGNDGPKDSTIITPSDADSVIAVAATVPEGNSPAKFTSRGPRGDGKIKPDIAAQGVGVVCINPGDSLGLSAANGTSLATPLIAGSMSLMVSAFPEKAGHELRNALFSTAMNAKEKNTSLGFGLAQVHTAMLETGILISPMITYPVGQYQRIVFLLQSAFPIIGADIYYRKKGDVDFQSIPAFRHDTLHSWAIDLLRDTLDNDQYECYVIAKDAKRLRMYPPILPNKERVFTFVPNDTIIPCGVPMEVLPLHSYPMTINETTMADGFHVPIPRSYRFQTYSLNGSLLTEHFLDLAEGTYTDSHLSKLIEYSTIVGLIVRNESGIVYSTILSPYSK